MKKITLSLLIASLFILLVACGGSKESTNQEGSSSNQNKSTDQNTDSVTYPTQPITLVVPFGAGADTDLNARITARYLEEELGQPVVVTNIEGSGSAIGTQEVFNSDPDGYTILFTHNNLLLNKVLGISDISYNDFEIGGTVASDYTDVVIVHNDSGYTNLEDLIKDAKSNPGELSVGVGFGSYSQLIALALEKAADIELNIIDVGGGADQRIALSGGRADIITAPYGQMEEFIDAGEYKSLGLLTADRVPNLEEEPTLSEQGVDLALDKHYFLFLPPETNEEIVSIFTDALNRVAENDNFKEEMSSHYATANFISPEETLNLLKETEDIYIELRDDFN